MKVFKLKKIGVRKAEAISPGRPPGRDKFEKGLEELRRVNSMEDYRTALAAGVEFSIDGFRRRVKIGNEAMRTTHSDLFDELKQTLQFIHKEILRVPKNAKGRSKRAPGTDLPSDTERRLSEVTAMLDRRERDFLDLLQELRVIRSQA